uniref:Uncharacterized protein n=1 Tax=Lutzomyia longipalpis TaxID=7200 RepID=A0A1B0CL57_LUTLO
MFRCTQTFLSTVRLRWGCERRWASSVVSVDSLPDFPAVNEPVLGYLAGLPRAPGDSGGARKNPQLNVLMCPLLLVVRRYVRRICR